jgi:hypothetical protein
MVDKVALEKVFLAVCRLPISASFHIYSVMISSVKFPNWGGGICGGTVEGEV